MKSRRIAMAIVAAAVAVGPGALAGCNTNPGGDATAGAAVFQSACAACHGPDGKPTETMIARLGVRDLTAPEFRARATPGLVEQQVRSGSKNKLMPAFAEAMNDGQIKAVAAFVASPQFLAHK
jgi:cytochrome c oxidase cbb3-type subunit 3